MEQAEAEEQRLELIGLFALAELLVVQVVVGAVEVRAQAGGRLHGHFDAVLQHGNGELRRGHAGQPQAEVAVHVLVEFLADALQLGSPGDGQVALGLG